MKRIDFYIVQAPNEKSLQLFACRLTEKAYKNQHRIYIHVENETATYAMDELLWTYHDDSFLPHNCYGEGPTTPPPPIQIGYHLKPETHHDVLINLHQNVPEFYMQFARILELVSQDPVSQEHGRERYRFYRSKGYEIITHKMPLLEA